MKSPAFEKIQTKRLQQASSHWFAALCDSFPTALSSFDCRLIAGEGRARKLFLSTEAGFVAPSCAERDGCAAIFSGLLYNADEFYSEGARQPGVPNPADTVLAAYEQDGEKVFSRLRGTFALVMWDARRELFMCLRDPLGNHPLFYAETDKAFLVSPAIPVLTRQPKVSAALNRAALADYILDRYGFDETFFESVRRVPPGHVLRMAPEGRRLFRYWDPAPDGVVEWLTDDHVERFDEVLDRAVSRCLNSQPAGIFLSGGLDSVSVAAVALDQTQTLGQPKPLALSLIFPEPEVSEEALQRSVAEQLGLPYVLKHLFEASAQNGGKGLLAPGLAMSANLSAPLLNPWLPAYATLAGEGKQRGCEVILTGGGGDEWLSVGPFLMADLLRKGDFGGAYRLWKALERSYNRPKLALFTSVFWRCGVKPILHQRAHGLAKRVVPWALKLRRRALLAPPAWVAPDAALRQELLNRRENGNGPQVKPSGSYYVDDGRRALDHPLVSWESEELFEVYSRVGIRVAHPFWDPDLLDLLYRTPPFALLHNGRNKGLVRRTLTRRFPELGFEQQRKINSLNFYASLIHREGAQVLQKLGPIEALADLGIVEGSKLQTEFQRVLTRKETGTSLYRFWNIMNLESWVRTHAT
jgi:asparagine synthetase B (glutamine-hydrolysing)